MIMNAVIKLRYETEQIAVVALDDPSSKNTFSHAWIEGIEEAFEEIRKKAEIKVVVVHGIGNFFCCGGTKEELLDIATGKITFPDLGNFYRRLLDCELPTVAAMQGHALGGGVAFGLYADLIVMAEECYYSTNFMRYGFTPGQGATYIIPEKCGRVLGTEMLFTARNYQGKELKERGISAKVVKKADVLTTALALAKDLAEKPLIALKLLKKHLTQKIKDNLDAAIVQEVDMHAISFRQPEVKERIERLFE